MEILPAPSQGVLDSLEKGVFIGTEICSYQKDTTLYFSKGGRSGTHQRRQDATPNLENWDDQGTVLRKRWTCEILCCAHIRQDNIKKTSSTPISFRDLIT